MIARESSVHDNQPSGALSESSRQFLEELMRDLRAMSLPNQGPLIDSIQDVLDGRRSPQPLPEDAPSSTTTDTGD